MLGRFRSAFYSAIGSVDTESGTAGGDQAVAEAVPGQGGSRRSADAGGNRANNNKYPYQRPVFLQLFSDDEIQATADHQVRPIIVPRDIKILPWFSGYAEAINSGKSLRNEDQAAFHRGVLRTCDLSSSDDVDDDRSFGLEIPYVYFGTFDGHAGSGCAVTAANELHQVVHNRLMGVLRHLVHQAVGASATTWRLPTHRCDVTVDSLVIGALESAFWEADAQIGDDKKRYKMLGGCTVLVSLFILGKLYVANAGDSRAVLCRGSDNTPHPMSFDFTPVSERQRLQQLAYHKPHLLGSEYTQMDFCGRRPLRKDVGSKMLYRDAHMTGWAYKAVDETDLKFPVVYGEGKRSRLLATIGVTRGFGDHDLRAQSSSSNVKPIYVKPFLTPQPEVMVFDVETDLTEADVLVMATDGLWDVIPNERMADIVGSGLRTHSSLTTTTSMMEKEEARIEYRYISIAQDLVMAARGKLVDRNWKRSVVSKTTTTTTELLPATIDDISVFVVPLLPYKEEYAQWKASKIDVRSTTNESTTTTTTSDDDDEMEDAKDAVEEVVDPPVAADDNDDDDDDDDDTVVVDH